MAFSDDILRFIKNLSFPFLPIGDIEVMNPFMDSYAMLICETFYKKYYSDNNDRTLIIGINPGRFGGGVTGIPFTDPIRLQNNCGIENEWPKKQELSSLFIYDMINAFGGVNPFYKKFYFTAISPLGFTRQNKNLNYYDDKDLQKGIKDFVIDCMNKQLKFGINRDVAFCLGDGKNYKYLSGLNKEQNFFKKVIPLPHPRFIMQYKLKKKEEYIRYYLQHLKNGAE
ncbi:MAG: uracil-DNA glycosylase family protein [Ginsengibacter sp.]